MNYVEKFQHNEILRKSFNELSSNIFGFDFEEFYKAGLWENRYLCHAFEIDYRIVSNVSGTRFDLVIEGKPMKAMQIGTVMTTEDFRGKGLAVELLNKVLEKYKDEIELFYLFGHKGVLEYYKKLGFTLVKEDGFSTSIQPFENSKLRFRKIEFSKEADLNLIKRLTYSRVPISNVCGVTKDWEVFSFYAMGLYSDEIFYFNDIDAILIFSKDNKTVHLRDILCERKLSFNEVVTAISTVEDSFKKIMFHFTPEFDGLSVKPEERDPEDTLFILGNRNVLPESFLYPEIAHT